MPWDSAKLSVVKCKVISAAVSLAVAILAVSDVALAGGCTQSKVEFSTSALESLLNEPEAVLAGEQTFWELEPAQRYTRMWAEAVDYEIDYEDWRASVLALSGLPAEERLNHTLFRMTEGIVASREIFLSRALPFICSYQSREANLDVSVYFTALIPARSFLWEGIVINVSAPYWNGNPDNILNNLVHEIWHVGYAKARNARSRVSALDGVRFDMLDSLHNEGVATYVGYQADEIFNAPDEKDYRMLEDPQEVSRLLEELNHLFAQVAILPSEEVDQMSWQKGVVDRAYYVVGAMMASTIENRLGREALVETVSQGPVHFAELYNSLAPAERKLLYRP